MNPGTAPVPQCFPGEGALAAEHPTLGSRIWVDWERLLGIMVFFVQLAQTDAAHYFPRALGFRYRSPHMSCVGLFVRDRGEGRPSDVHPRWPLIVGATAAQRLPSALVTVVGRPRMVPRSLISIHRAAATSAHAVATHSLLDADAPISAFL